MKRVTEPARKSLLDVVQKNLRAAGKDIYISRIVYIGEYLGSPSDLEKKMETIIDNLAADYVSASISGIFLVYPENYVHMLEAEDDVIYQHLKDLYDPNKATEDCKLGKSIFLPSYHHVHQRFFTEWFHVHTIPPTLIEKPQSYELSDIQTQVSNCLTKVYTLCDTIGNTARDSSVPMKNVMQNIIDKVARLLPESTVLEYLLSANSPVLQTAEKYLEICSTVPLINLYQDTIWPPPLDFMFRGGLEKQKRRSTVRASIKEIRASRLKQRLM